MDKQNIVNQRYRFKCINKYIKWKKRKWKSLSCVQLFATLWSIQSMEWILQVRILEWVAYPFSCGSSLIDLGSPALQVDSLLTELSEKLFPPTGDLPNSGIKPRSPALEADSLSAEPPGKQKEFTYIFFFLFFFKEWINNLHTYI